jgi:transposase-like protein
MEEIMRKSYTAEFKAKVALEAVKGEQTVSEIASKYEIHPNQVSTWKKQFLEKLPSLFVDKRTKKGMKNKEKKSEELYKTIGQLQVENGYLRKKYKQVYGREPD